jgi:hypothetical protein
MKWCNRTLVSSPWNYCLVLTQKEFDRILKKHKISDIEPDDERLSNAAATVSFYTTHKGCRIAIVKMGENYKKYSKIQIYGLLVHEGTHIWQAVRETLFEDEPSSEFEAYSVQKIAQELMWAFERETRKAKKK